MAGAKLCIDGTKRLCHIRGKKHKKVWIAAGDIILIGLRDYQDNKADVILKYMPDEARLLKAYVELPENTRLNEGIAASLDEEDDGAGDGYTDFEDEDIDKIKGLGFSSSAFHLFSPLNLFTIKSCKDESCWILVFVVKFEGFPPHGASL
ncbi:hypothetical protein NE237_020062 [Protea cynaroides]|uniref:S1-like domain-containing protein n=1 Tax=Protea cynaroides TaxID=273540 RepID=A0A9Q0K293_9MAGN|nr:hypothetical protein NE237_020062 [Protea cynaroides]